MNQKYIAIFLTIFILLLSAAGCGRADGAERGKNGRLEAASAQPKDAAGAHSASGSEATVQAEPASKITKLKDGLSTVRYDGDYGFGDFLSKGGASSDAGVVQFLTDRLLSGAAFHFGGDLFGCGTLSVESPEGGRLFGRNFDWDRCDALIVRAEPDNGYASISTVNTDFIRSGAGSLLRVSPDILTLAALYAPLDGMNEKGLCVAVNMISDSASIDQDTDKPDITTTTSVRLLLDQAADTGEALALLKQYDMHASMGMMVHFALADAKGRSVAVDYVDNEMVITETPVVTNFYLAPGDKNGVGTAQSHERFQILTDRLAKTQTMSMEDVRDALDSVSKDNFGEFESTEWSVVYDQSNGEIRYYHRENYENSYTFTLD